MLTLVLIKHDYCTTLSCLFYFCFVRINLCSSPIRKSGMIFTMEQCDIPITGTHPLVPPSPFFLFINGNYQPSLPFCRDCTQPPHNSKEACQLRQPNNVPGWISSTSLLRSTIKQLCNYLRELYQRYRCVFLSQRTCWLGSNLFPVRISSYPLLNSAWAKPSLPSWNI